MKAKLLLLAVVTLALAGCGSSGVAIPKMGDRTLEQAFTLLRSKGFRVSLAYSSFSLAPGDRAEIEQTIPAPGTHVAPSSVVTLFPFYTASGGLTTATHPKHYRLPDFTGRSPGAAMDWADRHGVWWLIPLPRLHGSLARSLFAAYVVTAQRPAAGKLVRETGWLKLTVRPRR